MQTLTVHDETSFGEQLSSITFRVPSDQITVEELIRSRVFQEAKDANAKLATKPEAEVIVQPSEAEVALNGPKTAKSDPVQWREELDKALEAFTQNRILVFVDDRQMTDLSQVISIEPTTEVKFLRLTMLMGG